jgi:hypothetical protein
MMKEPEEIIEVRLIELMQSVLSDVDVIGALSPVSDGEQKQSPDTYVSIFVDLSSQNLDWRGGNVPCSFSVRLTVHYANADDATGCGFRDTCRSVRTALFVLTGDGCEGLNADGFKCDQFTLDSTSTALDQESENGGMDKTYNATLTGRITTRKEDN